MMMIIKTKMKMELKKMVIIMIMNRHNKIIAILIRRPSGEEGASAFRLLTNDQ